MTSKLYLTPLPKEQSTDPPSSAIGANVNVQGLLEQSGLASERIATASVDLSLTGRISLGEFSKVLAREMQSIGEASFNGVPFADDANVDEDDNTGYYDVSNVDVNPAHDNTTLAYQYRVDLNVKGTRETHWRAVETNPENANTGIASSGTGMVGIPTEASTVRWFDTANGTEAATVDSTENAEYGDVDLYDPTEPTFDSPTLVYGLSYEHEGPVDVRVWDDVGEASKFATYDGNDIRQWVHAYHAAFEYEGDPVVDNGLLRVAVDSSNSNLDVDQWNDGTSSWDALATVGGSGENYTLYDWDFRHIGPAEVRVFTEWEDTSDSSVHAAELRVERGIDRAVVRQPSNGTIPSDLETMLSPIASNQTTDAQPTQNVRAKEDVQT